MDTIHKMLLLSGSKTTYTQMLQQTAPFAMWPLSETSGTNADDPIGGFDGTYAAGITLKGTTFPDGSPAPLFDATGDVITLPSASLDTPFDGAVGSMGCWLKARNAGVWSDGVSRIPFSVGADAANRIFLNRSTVTDRTDMFYRANNVNKSNLVTSFNPARWFHMLITWDKNADQVKFYVDGVQSGSTATSLGVWADTIANSFTALGNYTSAGGAFFWDGYIKYPALWNRVLTPTEVAGLVPPSFLV